MPFYNLHTLLIERRVEERLNRTNVDGKTLKLVVNAQEFLHLVCKQHPEYALQLAVGEYCILHELIVDAVLTLLDCDASLCFVFPSVSLGDSAPESVFSDIDNAIAQTEYRNLILACQNGYSKKSLPPPILGLEQLQDSLRSITATVGPERLSIHVNESCPHVIQCVVKLAQSNSNAAEVCYILTDDSIYYSFRACSCIRYSDITPNVRSYIIWSRKGISAAVGLTETQFVELCLSLGNEAIPAALLNAVGPGRAEDIFDLMKDSELNFRRSAEDDITASRLMEIRCALEQEVRKDITRNESEDKSVLMVLPIAVEDALEDLLEVEDCSNFKIVATNFAAVCPSVSQAHAAALIGVSSIIEESRHRKNCCSDKDFSMPAWDIYHSAVYFQLVYRLWRKHAIRFGQTVDIIQAPRDVFSCSIYFAILNGLIELAPVMPVPSRDNFSSEMTDAYSSMEHLPIDSNKADILAKIARDRVVLIHGETGCGKSTRLPLFIYQDLVSRGNSCKMMIAQPRRIAAYNVYKRLKCSIGVDTVGLRLGQGVREGGNCAITLVTTGKLSRYLSGNLLRKFTHIIIDEVHDRSIDNDLSCLFVRDLLMTNPTIKVILMSATLQFSIYQQYFSSHGDYGDLNYLSVGVKRFPARITYIEDIGKPGLKLYEMLKTYRGTFDDAKAGVLAVRQYEIVEYIVKNLATVGTGVLVFVSGMQDINELYGLLEDCLSMRSRKSKKFRVFAIHADISLEDQQEAFFPVCSDEIKVILATNAAESSITIPDVDIVIDMGIHKAMFFDEAHHRSYVRSTWISKASATQRAGRTGRTRPGEVYRLYSRELFEYLDEYSTAEVKRLPMQDVIIRLRYNFEQTYNFKGVVPILQSLIEPPSVDNIDRSFEILFNNSLITEPSDGGNLTVLGKFCSALPMDIRLGKLIAYGILFGVAEEAVILSSALSLQKSIFRVASPFVQRTPEELNNVVTENFFAAKYMDGGAYSEPIMYLRLLLLYEEQPKRMQSAWLFRHGLSHSRFSHFRNWAFDCLRQVPSMDRPDLKYNRFSKGNIQLTIKNSDLNNTKLNLLRLILTWTSDDNIIIQEPIKLKVGQSLDEIVVMSRELTDEHLKEILPPSITWATVGSGATRCIQFLTDSQVTDDTDRYFTPLIQDAKEGVRLLNALRGAHRNGILFRHKGADSSASTVVDSKETAKTTDKTNSTEDYFELKCKLINPKWSFLNVSEDKGHRGPVHLPKQSVTSFACSIKEVGCIFGVANKINSYISRDGSHFLSAEGVTLLPPGEKWLSLALHCATCITVELSEIYRSPVGALSKLVGNDVLTERQYRACVSISQHLFAEPFQPIKRCDAVICKVNELFASWTDQINFSGESIAGGDCEVSTPAQHLFIPLPNSVNMKSINDVASQTSAPYKTRKQACPWCNKPFASVRDHIAFLHPDKLNKFIEVSETEEPSSTKSGIVCPPEVQSTEDSVKLNLFKEALCLYYAVAPNKNRIQNILRHLKKISQLCLFCRFQHHDSDIVFQSHPVELHVLLKMIERKTGTFAFGPKFDTTSQLDPFKHEFAAEFEFRFAGSFSESIVSLIANNHLREVYGININNKFGIQVNNSFRNYLSHSRKRADNNKCQFCSDAFADLPGHLVLMHLTEIHAAIGGLDGTKNTQTVQLTSISKEQIITGTTLICNDIVISACSKNLAQDTAPAPLSMFTCPKCDYLNESPAALVDHYGGHFKASFEELLPKKKVAVKIKSNCPLCKDKKIFMLYGQLLDHVMGCHVSK